MRRATTLLVCMTLAALVASATRAATQADFQPDPRSVQRHGPAYRYPQAGWIILHIEGEPYERGYQHGRLMAPEIAAFLRCAAAVQSPKAPSEGWKNARSLANALFVRRTEKEYLEEMKGIADGATAAGCRFDNRPIDLVDIVALNAWAEVDTLDSALEATPTGLEGVRFPHPQPRAMPKPKPMHCSAFAATGPATADGKIVFGHITMFGLYPSNFFNVWLDVKPAKGHRVLMQTYPGGIQSGMDYYMNDAGLLVTETTISQTTFDIQGMTVASRIRQTLQYADSIDTAVAILGKANNGLYTNEWLLADIKTNEIAMFELGTARSKLYRSSKNEWVGGTEGFYWGCNNTKDLQVRLETIPGVSGRPANVVFHPSDRDRMWLRLYAKHRGKIDAGFGREAFTTPPLAAIHSLDAKFTTTDLAKDLKTWALFGPPLGRTWEPTQEERQKYPEIRPLVSNPWAILHADPPAKVEVKEVAVDLRDASSSRKDPAARQEEDDKPLPSVPAWHGTLLPKTDADIWLASGFANYERIVALEKSLGRHAAGAEISSSGRERLALMLNGYRSDYLTAARAATEVPLAGTRAELARDEWYRVAAGKGVLLLNDLRRHLGAERFDELMDSFGRAHAGKAVTAAEFWEHVEKTAGKGMQGFFAAWLDRPGLPDFTLVGKPVVDFDGKTYKMGATLRAATAPAAVPAPVEVLVVTEHEHIRKTISFSPTAAETPFTLETTSRPLRLVIDPQRQSANTRGGAFSLLSFEGELEQTLIVHGTLDENCSNREAAEALQRAIRVRHSNYTVPVKSDREATDEDLRTHHVLLIGRPDSNAVIERFRAALPVSFGSRSFTVRNEWYAHPGSAVIAAAENPLNRRYSVVIIAGLSAASTLQAATRRAPQGTEVLVLANGAKPRGLIVPARELVWTFENGSPADKAAAAREQGKGQTAPSGGER